MAGVHKVKRQGWSTIVIVKMSEGEQLKVYSMEEVEKHNTAESLWLVIHDKVYDVTTFMEEVSMSVRCVPLTLHVMVFPPPSSTLEVKR